MICRIAEPEEMPIDKNGVRADAIMDGGATVNRSNYGRMYEHYFNAASRDILIRMRHAFGITPTDITTQHKVEDIYNNNHQLFDQMYHYLMGYYEILTPNMFADLVNAPDEVKINHLSYITDNKWQAIHLEMPTDNPVSYSHAVEAIEKLYQPLHDKVTYTYAGVQMESTEKVRIASLYVMLLEKTGDDWSSTASSKLQHFGLPSQITKNNKFATPIRNQALRGLGEAEGRILVSHVDDEVVAELMDRSNNPTTHREIVKNILTAEYPTNIERLVDRDKIPLGGAKPIQIVNHMALCAGWKFKYTPDPAMWADYTHVKGVSNE